ncbi:GxxExxY protein [Coraliomargarita sinensis]|uniref:GxxExxY protein n=1 Tax=Coraliomargarita sinensis TaxID=2174842 RepID=A0A317ZCT7_9BACT|nr:GxxExxY protein [Coraliomargarita sinensis]PXA03015.1 GxxExxY protein [Coraliomargarita sinensis]
MNTQKLIDTIRQTGYETHVYFKNGYLEKVYENSLANRLRKKGLKVRQQHPLNVIDEDGNVVGEYFADLFVENSVIVELKALKNLNENHSAQVLSYLKTSQIKHGMLMNFGAAKFEVKKYIL